MIAGFGMIYLVSRFIQVPAIQIATLFSWGLGCMLFSYELGGAKHVYRQGFEERNAIEKAWLIAGAGCMVGAVVIMVMYF
jgi:hypothetical protein